VNDKLMFVAIGGNSLIKTKELKRVEDQHRAIRETVRHLAGLIRDGYQLVISHGNGPQVGFIMRRSEVARRLTGLHPVPLINAVADTQGSIGYQMQQSLNNELARLSIGGQCVTVITQVLVDSNDPGFRTPSKPIGEFFDGDQLASIREDNPHWTLVEDAGRGWRRVVPSPEPQEIIEKGVIESLLNDGYHVVCVGGGGIPVVQTDEGLDGVDAVIDKDLASGLLANKLGARLFLISTSVEQVYINFGKPGQYPISIMTMEEAEKYMNDGQFAPGSMLPKIQAALRFLRGGGKEVVITSPDCLEAAVLNGKGTHVVA
jgi:carbamate kinase